ncbi:Transcription factor bHLH96 [Dichanthelium oligosanthes]|uniref:Transcription factor bHLH96 n=1 Tax=Dichanthelium oligosanthes TaxID=888268 RepID=A0A1E5UYM4_9POAL|nr:Transcription factor bHLH96 [Dichanthelium oligosanthes]
MALLEAVVFPPDHSRVPCCVLRGYGVSSAGEFEGIIKRGVVVQEDGEPVATPPHGSGCCAWAGDAATSWVGPVPSTLATSSARRPVHHQPAVTRRLRRRRGTIAKASRMSVAEAESQRQNHIAVERNRRRQMNEYLAALRALMPPSYARRGDQASIVGGAIDFVKELEHHLQTLQAQKRPAAAGHGSERFPGFFTFPQYSTAAAVANVVDDRASSSGENNRPTTRPGVADVEAAVSEGHATVKVLAPRRQQMLLRLLLGMQRRGLTALHLNASTIAADDHRMVLYTFTVKMMGEAWQLSSAGDVAAAVHDTVADMDIAEERAV